MGTCFLSGLWQMAVACLFELKDEIYGGNYDTFRAVHTHSHYRVLEYEMIDGKLKLKNRYRFKAQDARDWNSIPVQ